MTIALGLLQKWLITVKLALKKLQYIEDATNTFVIVAFVKNIGTTVCERS